MKNKLKIHSQNNSKIQWKILRNRDQSNAHNTHINVLILSQLKMLLYIFVGVCCLACVADDTLSLFITQILKNNNKRYFPFHLLKIEVLSFSVMRFLRPLLKHCPSVRPFVRPSVRFLQFATPADTSGRCKDCYK
jgi:hypothetical protein